jgi:Co/Zn/Cd efflux system component
MSALIKGIVMLALGLIVLGEAGYQALNGVAPAAHGMGAFALLALVVNLICFGLLWRFKSDDLNMRSTWLCSRNDIIANASVFGAAILVGWTGSRWPDVLLGAAIAALFLQSAWQVIRDARVELREAKQATDAQASDEQAASDQASSCATSSCCAPPTAATVVEQSPASGCCSGKGGGGNTSI